MSYLVTVSYDLKNADSSTYKVIDDLLSDMGFSDSIVGSSGKELELPDNTYAGEFEGESVSKVRQDLCDLITEEFKEAGVKASIFVTVGGNWAWGIRHT